MNRWYDVFSSVVSGGEIRASGSDGALRSGSTSGFSPAGRVTGTSGARLVRGVAASLMLGLAGVLFAPGTSQAATVTGSNSVTTSAGTIDFTVTVDDAVTVVSIEWPAFRWVGLNFQSTTASPHQLPPYYAIVSDFDRDPIFEASLANRRITPQILGDQDLTILDEGEAAVGRQFVIVQRPSDTGATNDFQFEAVVQDIDMTWALGIVGQDTTVVHNFRDYTSVSLAPIPIPAALPLLGSALVGFMLLARRRTA